MRRIVIRDVLVDKRFELIFNCAAGPVKDVIRIYVPSGGTCYALDAGGKLWVFNDDKSRYFSRVDTLSQRYVIAAYKLDILSKPIYTKFEQRWEKQRAAANARSNAANALDYLKMTGIAVPAALTKALTKIKGQY